MIFGAGVVALDLLAYRRGVDSRDGSDWVAHRDRAPYLVDTDS